jgi:DNA polymerase-3 subunit epsilon
MYFFIDVETSGFDQFRHSLIEVGALFVDRNFNVLKEYNTLVKPFENEWWSKQAQEIHGISLSDLGSAPELGNVMLDIFDICDSFLGKYEKFTHIDHSRNRFDWKWMVASSLKTDTLYSHHRKFFHWEKYESTESLSRGHLPHLNNHRLSTICAHYNIALDHHSALSDVHGCFEIYKRLKGVKPVMIPVTKAGLDWSLEKRKNHVHGKAYLNDGTESIDENKIDNTRLGYVGEWAFLQHYPNAEHVNKDWDFNFKGKKVDIKTSRKNDVVYVPLKDAHRVCDFYFFLYFNTDMMVCEFLGYETKENVLAWPVVEGRWGKQYQISPDKIKKVTTVL